MLRYSTWLLPALALLASAKDPNSTVLNEWPMVMVHDAATTYLKGGFLHQVREKRAVLCCVCGGARGSHVCGVCVVGCVYAAPYTASAQHELTRSQPPPSASPPPRTQINDWAKTQPDGGAGGLLKCGARSFDWRPKIKSDGSVIMHHGR